MKKYRDLTRKKTIKGKKTNKNKSKQKSEGKKSSAQGLKNGLAPLFITELEQEHLGKNFLESLAHEPHN